MTSLCMGDSVYIYMLSSALLVSVCRGFEIVELGILLGCLSWIFVGYLRGELCLYCFVFCVNCVVLYCIV